MCCGGSSIDLSGQVCHCVIDIMMMLGLVAVVMDMSSQIKMLTRVGEQHTKRLVMESW
jgi:hypothetical protein